MDNAKYFKDMYVPLCFRYKELNPEEIQIIRELPENQRCMECGKTVWVCECFA